jgi:hypothetical protein
MSAVLPRRAVPPRLVFGVFVALLAGAPLVLPEFTVTLLNYIGLYALVALGSGAAHRCGRADLVRAGGVRRPGRLHDRGAHRVDRAARLARVDRRQRLARAASPACC